MINSVKELLAKSFPTIMQFDELGDLVPTICDMSVKFKENEQVRVIILKEEEYNKLNYVLDNIQKKEFAEKDCKEGH